METAEPIVIKHKGAVGWIILNRPDQLNALTSTMIRRLEQEALNMADAPDVRAVVLTGAGKAFCAGVDMNETVYNPLNARTFLKIFNRMLKAVEMMPQPTVAMLNGTAVAGGLELALACTFRIASSRSRMGLPEINLGLVAAAGTTYRLPRLVGFGKALEISLLGELMDGRQAAACGLIHRAVDAEDLEAETRKLAQRLAQNPPIAMSLIKDALCNAATPHLDNAALIEILSASVNHYCADKREGLDAFFAKRKPQFKGH